MLKRRNSDFTVAVWKAAARVGGNGPKVADEIISDLFPRTCEEARIEDAFGMFRQGVIIAVKRAIRQLPDEEGEDGDPQGDFHDISPEFAPIVARLKKDAYYVEEIEEYVPVWKLIAFPAMLDDARKHLRRKGQECLAEAKTLDALYMAVTR